MDSEDIVRKFHQKRGQIRDLRSGIRKKFIPDPDPGGKKTPDPGSGSATLRRNLLSSKFEMKTIFLKMEYVKKV
jgi:hypothetical protein